MTDIPGPINYDGLSIAEATAIQTGLRNSLTLNPLKKELMTIAGADISLDLHSEIIFAGIVILRYSDLQPIAYSLVKSRSTFPYVPGFLAFREVPALLEVFRQIPVKPDVLVVDGHGIAHRRRMGIAAHFGALTDTAAMGCAKNILFGKYEEPGVLKGDYSIIQDKGETLGFALRTKVNVKPVFISPGNNMSMENSLAIALRCAGRYRLPEPTRRAHEFVNLFRTGKLKEGYHELPALSLF